MLVRSLGGRFPGGGCGNPLHYSCLENPMDRRAWQAKVHGVAKSRTAMLLSPPGKKTEWGLGEPYLAASIINPDPGIEPGSPALEADTLTSEPPGKPPY